MCEGEKNNLKCTEKR